MRELLRAPSLFIALLIAATFTGCTKKGEEGGYKKVKIPQKVEVRKEYRKEKRSP